jgi:hypothetical protein
MGSLYEGIRQKDIATYSIRGNKKISDHFARGLDK